MNTPRQTTLLRDAICLFHLAVGKSYKMPLTQVPHNFLHPIF